MTLMEMRAVFLWPLYNRNGGDWESVGQGNIKTMSSQYDSLMGIGTVVDAMKALDLYY